MFNFLAKAGDVEYPKVDLGFQIPEFNLVLTFIVRFSLLSLV